MQGGDDEQKSTVSLKERRELYSQSTTKCGKRMANFRKCQVVACQAKTQLVESDLTVGLFIACIFKSDV